MAKIWNQSKYLSIDEYTHTHTHTTLEYYSVLKRKEILSFAATWIGQENIMLHEISQTQKDKNQMI